jgi:carboxypeptidase Taq
VDDLQRASAVLEWDQQTYMPPSGAAARAEQIATLQEMAHNLFTSDRVGKLLEDLSPLAAQLAYESDDASLVRVTRREYEKRRRLPDALVAERARTAALAHAAWEIARAESDFDHFRPHLEKIVDLSIQVAEALGYEEHIYDALLDLYEPEVKTAQVASIFGEMKAALMPLVQAISERLDAVDDGVLEGHFELARQQELGSQVLGQMGFDFARGRQDTSTHPFTTSFSPDDVRLTTRFDPQRLPPALFATIHEGGHALYEQGLPAAFVRTPLCDGASMGVHESQSRMWENVVGRSLSFCQYLLPHLRALFPGTFDALNAEALYRAVNCVRPGLIRVEADEVTYNLHIFLRFEIEQDLLTGQLQVADLPEQWNARMNAYLGQTPPNDALGVLQDVHWSGAMFGYFPTYSLGNLLSVQFFEQALSTIPGIPDQIARGEFAPLLSWLREHVHSQGARFTPGELVSRVTGSPMTARPFLAYIGEKYARLYDL